MSVRTIANSIANVIDLPIVCSGIRHLWENAITHLGKEWIPTKRWFVEMKTFLWLETIVCSTVSQLTVPSVVGTKEIWKYPLVTFIRWLNQVQYVNQRVSDCAFNLHFQCCRSHIQRLRLSTPHLAGQCSPDLWKFTLYSEQRKAYLYPTKGFSCDGSLGSIRRPANTTSFGEDPP